MLLTDFDDLVVSHILCYMDLIDHINLCEAYPCFQSAAEFKYKKCTTFDLEEYLWIQKKERIEGKRNTCSVGKVLSYIGRHISLLIISTRNDENITYSKEIQANCVNVKHLVWLCDLRYRYRQDCEFSDALTPKISKTLIEYSKWVEKLKLERLTSECRTGLEMKLFHKVTTLKEINQMYLYHLPLEFLAQNIDIDTLYINVMKRFNFDILAPLKNLRHLGINTSDPYDLIRIIPVLKMHKVKRFQICGMFDITDEFNQCLKQLAGVESLNQLSIQMNDDDDKISKTTIETLNLFHLTSLHMHCYIISLGDHEIIPNVQPNLIHLQLDFWGVFSKLDATVFLIKHLKKLERFSVRMSKDDIAKFLDKNFLIEILNTSSKRATLTVKLFDVVGKRNAVPVKTVKLYFKGCMYKVDAVRQKEIFPRSQYHASSVAPWCLDDVE